jgi:hypothetical protein
VLLYYWITRDCATLNLTAGVCLAYIRNRYRLLIDISEGAAYIRGGEYGLLWICSSNALPIMEYGLLMDISDNAYIQGRYRLLIDISEGAACSG